MFENVPIQPRDAREASDVFYKQYQGDVSLNYENEVILTNEMYGENALPYVVPDNNVLVGALPFIKKTIFGDEKRLTVLKALGSDLPNSTRYSVYMVQVCLNNEILKPYAADYGKICKP